MLLFTAACQTSVLLVAIWPVLPRVAGRVVRWDDLECPTLISGNYMCRAGARKRVSSEAGHWTLSKRNTDMSRFLELRTTSSAGKVSSTSNFEVDRPVDLAGVTIPLGPRGLN